MVPDCCSQPHDKRVNTLFCGSDTQDLSIFSEVLAQELKPVFDIRDFRFFS